MTPEVGETNGAVEALTGRDIITGEQLAPWERIIGIIPLIGDAGKIIDAGSDIARAAEGAKDAANIAAGAGDLTKARKAAEAAENAAKELDDVAGTLVLTPEGTKPIEQLKVGELVWAGEPETGVVKACRVLQTFEQQASVVLGISVRWSTPVNVL